jgi:hypothetical protein
MVELRLQLDAVLDVENTVRPTQPTAAQDRSRRQQYCAQRLVKLAQDPGLGSFDPDGGDPDEWTPSLPTDALLVAHVLRHRAFPRLIAMAQGIWDFKPAELALLIAAAPTADGSVGTSGSSNMDAAAPVPATVLRPIFAVRYSDPGGANIAQAAPPGATSAQQQQLLALRHKYRDHHAFVNSPIRRDFVPPAGKDQLFACILIVIGIVGRRHGGVYGGVAGQIDLTRLDLDRILPPSPFGSLIAKGPAAAI